MSPVPASPTADSPPIAEWFRRFAQAECGEEPLYKAMCGIAVREPGILGLLEAAPAEQRRPNLLLAAVQYLLLGGATHGLAAYYPSVGGARAVDDALHAVFVDFCETHRLALGGLIATHTTQTNETGRCAVLWPVLRLAAERQGAGRVALLDVGASAGLNLGVDRLAYDYGRFDLSPGGAQSPIRIACRLVGDAAPDAGDMALHIVDRRGIDPEPVDVNDEDSLRWLRACVWPHDKLRRERFDAAALVARKAGWRVEKHSDCTAAAEAWAEGVPADVLPVIFNSWVLTYFRHEARARHIERMRRVVQRRGAVWISAEAPEILIDESLEPPAVDPAHAELGPGTLWTLMRAGASSPSSQIVARSHPHGKWMQWLA